MNPNAFIGQPTAPTEAELTAALGPSRTWWDSLLAHLATELEVAEQEWKCYSRKAGWSLRLKRKDRAIVYLSPQRGSFLAAFALGDKAMEAARVHPFPPDVLKILAEARRYAEGTAVRIEVIRAEDLSIVQTLAAIKLAY